MEKELSSKLSNRLLRNAYLVLAIAFFFFVFQQQARSATHITSGVQGQDRKANELVVKLYPSEPGQRLQSLLLQEVSQVLGQNALLSIRPLKTDSSLNVLRFKPGTVMEKAAKLLSSMSTVRYAEPNYILRALTGEPNDPDFAKTWGLHNTGQADNAGQVGIPGADINVLPLWKNGITGSKEMVVAVIDTGVQWDHPDLADNLYVNTAEIADNGIDDDGNGFIDDRHGWNFEGDNNNSSDDNGHGTHCAGTIGGVGNNGVGVAGVSWKASLMPIKFLSASGSGTLADAVESINYATTMNVHIMSNSWGGGGFTQSMKDAIVAAKEKGILFVAAAGNSSADNDSTPAYPASYDVDNVLAVAATDNRDNLADFSSYGRTKVHVAAPGVKVYSSVPGGGYAHFSGTSMATPHVAGAAALLMSNQSDWDYAEVKRRLIVTSDPVPSLRRRVASRGRINVENALNGVIPPNDDPDENSWTDVSGNIESDHPYENAKEYTFEISEPGAKFIRVHFEKIDTEARYDVVSLIDASGNAVEQLSGQHENYMTDYVRGEKATIRFVSDNSITSWGFKINRIQVVR